MRVHIEGVMSNDVKQRQGMKVSLGLTPAECRSLAASLAALSTDKGKNAIDQRLAVGMIEFVRLDAHAEIEIARPNLSVVPPPHVETP